MIVNKQNLSTIYIGVKAAFNKRLGALLNKSDFG